MPSNDNKGSMRPQGRNMINPKKQNIMDKNKETRTAGDCINESLFWLQGCVDGTTQTREEVLAVLAQAIASLQAAYTRMMFA